MENLHLIVGLGNPGAEYARTRHNAGFLVVEKLAARWNADWRSDTRSDCRLARAQFGAKDCLLCEPQGFMNNSGEAVGCLSAYYRVSVERLLIVVDDADLPLGRLRLKPEGSSGGHHGLESVENSLGTQSYARLRVGIGRTAAEVREITGHVLGRFRKEETELVGLVLDQAARQIECWLTAGVNAAMNQFNGAVKAPDNVKQ